MPPKNVPLRSPFSFPLTFVNVYYEYDEVNFTCNAGYNLSAGDTLIYCIDKAWIKDNGDVPIVPRCIGKIY